MGHFRFCGKASEDFLPHPPKLDRVGVDGSFCSPSPSHFKGCEFALTFKIKYETGERAQRTEDMLCMQKIDSSPWIPQRYV